MAVTHTRTLHIDHAQEGTYLRLPFTMPAGMERLTISYRYERYRESDAGGGFTTSEEVNIIDLALVAPNGSEAGASEPNGASGSNKSQVTISATWATPGYRPMSLIPGVWQIIVGAYQVAPEGVDITYELTFEPKTRRLLRGDLHTHTLASDGVLTAEELGRHALRHGLDFIALTDHNQFARADTLPRIEGLTMIPGVEWTHYRGHANFLGVDQPFDGSYAVNTADEVLALFSTAHERGALITLNHPCEEPWEFLFDYSALPWDCWEFWNGPMRASNLQAVGLWQAMLAAGKRVPICAGSDYHRDSPFQMLGGPSLCVLADSAGAADILDAIRAGRSYAVFAPNGPTLALNVGDAGLGETASWDDAREVELALDGLAAGDVLRVATAAGSEVLAQAPAPGRWKGSYRMPAPGFARVEVLRTFLPGLPPLPALLSGAVWVEG